MHQQKPSYKNIQVGAANDFQLQASKQNKSEKSKPMNFMIACLNTQEINFPLLAIDALLVKVEALDLLCAFSQSYLNKV